MNQKETPRSSSSTGEKYSKLLEKKIEKRDGIRTVRSSLFTSQKEKLQAKSKLIGEFLENNSSVSKTLRKSDRFVKEEESVLEKSKTVITESLKSLYHDDKRRPKVKGLLKLNSQKVKKLKLKFEDGDKPIKLSGKSAKELERIANGASNGNYSTDITGAEIDSICSSFIRRNSKCYNLLFDTESSGSSDDEDSITDEDEAPLNTEETPTGSNESIESDNTSEQFTVDEKLNHLISSVTSPEDSVVFGVNGQLLATQRLNLESMESDLGTWALKPNPADLPTFRDVDQVQFAFRDVWQEWLDETTVELVDELYDRIVDLGGEFEPNKSPLNIRSLVKSLNLGIKTRIPSTVSEAIEITPKLWRQLPEYIQDDVELLAEEIAQIIEVKSDFEKSITYAIESDGTFFEYTVPEENWSPLEQLRDDIRDKPFSETSAVIAVQYLNHPVYGTTNEFRKALVDNKIKTLNEQRLLRLKEIQDILTPYKNALEEQESLDSIPDVKDMSVHEILSELEKKLNQDYSFKYYAANKRECSVNFGLMLTYRQYLKPCSDGAYRVGELVKTIPLAPKESRKYAKKIVEKKRRITKEIESSLRVMKDESQHTSKIENEILSKANSKNSYEQNAQGSFNIGFASGNSNLKTVGESARNSQDTKKAMRESVLKAAMEFKSERKVEINTENTYESEFSESGEIQNPNDELTLTCAFFELQRCFKVSESLHRMRPVIFVAAEMPRKIDEAWVLSNDWVIRRAILDDSFLDAIDSIQTIPGKELKLEQQRENIKIQRSIVFDLEQQLVTLRREATSRYHVFEAAVDKQAGLRNDDNIISELIPDIGIVDNVANWLFGGSSEADQEQAKLRREAAMQAYEKASRERDEMMGRLEREVTSLNAITARYTEAISEYLNLKTDVKRLLQHIKSNILHYMHAIWSYQPNDQRFFQLCEKEVVDLEGTVDYNIYPPRVFDPSSPRDLDETSTGTYTVDGEGVYTYEPEPNLTLVTKQLQEIADLDNLIGFKGNYMIFPVKQEAINPLHKFMMAPYLDNVLGLNDPDDLGSWSVDDFEKYVCCLKEKLGDQFDKVKEDLKTQYELILRRNIFQNDTLMVPTGELIIEALPGKQPILEDFKLIHRAIDVKKVQAEVREMEIENIRRAERINQDNLDDPKVDKKVFIDGNNLDTQISLDSTE